MPEKLNLFVQKIKEIYPNSYSRVLKELEKEPYTCFRVNTLKADEFEVLQMIINEGFNPSKGPFDFSYFLIDPVSSTTGLRLSETEFFKHGLIYIQSFSSMLAVKVLDPQISHDIGDLCASPGSKTSYISQVTQNKSCIFAYDNNMNRVYSLKSNLANLGVKNTRIEKLNSVMLGNNPVFINFFDRVLVDAPCSNEGLIRQLQSFQFDRWNPKQSKQLSQLQKKLIYSGVSTLKPGGTLVYSTCTYSPLENESVVNWALSKFENIYIEKINMPPNVKNYVSGFTSWRGSQYHKDLSNTIRILPDDLFGAFYIAKIVKR